MSDPKMTHIQGDLNISPGLDSSQGFGSLYVSGASSVFDVQGETFLDKANIDTTDGAFAVTGTNKITISPTGGSGNVEVTGSANSYFKTSSGTLDVEAIAGALTLTGNSASLISDTTTVSVTGATGITLASTANNITVNASSNFDVNASSAITMDANAASNFTVTGGGNITIDSTAGRTIIDGGSTASNSVTIVASAAAGGIDIDAGTAGIDILATDGPFSIDAQNVASNISLATNSNAQDLTISLTGVSDSSIVIDSSGTGSDAIKISALSGTGGIDINSGTSGIIADTTGSISLDATAASNFTTTGAFDLTVSSTGGSVVINSGEAAVDAVKILTSNAAGGLDVDAGTGGITIDTTAGFSIDSATASNITLTGTNDLTVNNTGGSLILQSNEAAIDAVRIFGSNATGGVDIDSGTGGITIDSQGGISIDSVGVASNFSVATGGAAQDLTIGLTGNTDSSIIISSTGTSTTDAIKLNATAGGMDLDAAGQINIDTTDTVNGIFIATNTSNVPVTIGTAASTTTIAGNLVVAGVTTKINTETLVVEDNIIYVNSGNGELGADGGLVVRRNQTTDNGGAGGDVVTDTGVGVVSSTFQTGSSGNTLILNASASGVNGYYVGWWVKITSGPGIDQVRLIKSYNATGQVAVVYETADNTATFTDGLDIVTPPASSNTYNLYNSPNVASFYDESEDTWTLAFTNIVPDPISVAGISAIVIQRYTSFNVGSVTIQDNGIPANSSLNVNYINEFTSDIGVTIEGVNINNGLIDGLVPDSTEIVELPDHATTAVEVTSTATIGSYTVMVDAVQATSGTSSYLRQAGGAFAVFAVCSTGTGGSINRLVSTKGTGNERVDGIWNTGEKFKLRHQPAKSSPNTVNLPYRIKISRVLL
jgi:hypothetical protein